VRLPDEEESSCFADVQACAGLPAERVHETAWSATRPRRSTAASPYTAVLVRGVGMVGSGRVRRVAVGLGPVTTNTPTGSGEGAMNTLN
jgi:hypothetical protein